MKFIILFEDDPAAPADVRSRFMPAHLAFLEANASSISAAGPLSDREGAPAGGLWVVDVDSPEDADRLVRADPFWPTGLRKSFRVLAWRQVFADGRKQMAT